jgi:predicted PhzF superfamily epimerase YddE/YHI9
MCWVSDSSTGPERSSGGAVKASPSAVRRTGTSPAPHCCTTTSPGSPQAFEVRAFFPKDGTTVEDPVTGSLNASLAQWLLRTGRATTPYVASQGTALGRSGRVHVSSDPDGTIWVGGGTVTCVRGQVEL